MVNHTNTSNENNEVIGQLYFVKIAENPAIKFHTIRNPELNPLMNDGSSLLINYLIHLTNEHERIIVNPFDLKFAYLNLFLGILYLFELYLTPYIISILSENDAKTIDPKYVDLLRILNIYGYDLEEEQTAAAVLEKMINIPVVNLGITGGNVFNIKHNLSELLKSHTPKAIVIAWPRPTRWTDPDGFNWGNWFFDEHIDSMPGLRDIPLDPVRFEEYKELLFSGKLDTLTYEAIDRIRELIKEYPSTDQNAGLIFVSPETSSAGLYHVLSSIDNTTIVAMLTNEELENSQIKPIRKFNCENIFYINLFSKSSL